MVPGRAEGAYLQRLQINTIKSHHLLAGVAADNFVKVDAWLVGIFSLMYSLR
jgi:hypothetical protein